MAELSITINGEEIPSRLVEIEHIKLRYYVENPRIYSEWKTVDLETVEQQDIERKMQQLEHTKRLCQSIEKNGGVTEPLIVRDGDLTVFDGNSRLAAIRKLSLVDPIKWSMIKCYLLPENIEDKAIFSLLGSYHIVGRKDWSPYEQAGYLYRRNTLQSITSEQMSKELGISKSSIDSMISVYKYMLDHEDDTASKWSYYDELLKNRSIKNFAKIAPELENIVVSQIKNDKIEKAEDIRKFTAIGKVKPKQRERIVKDFASGKKDLYECFEEARDLGATNDIFQKFEKFRDFSADVAHIKAEYKTLPADQQKQLRYAVKKIKHNLDSLGIDDKGLD
jgi:hypothetical protein